MAWFATLLAHIVVLFLIIAVPIRGAQRYRVLMRRIERHPELRVRFYVSGMLSQWLVLIPVAIVVFGLGWSPATLGLTVPNNLLITVPIALLLIILFYGQVFYIRRISASDEGRAQLRQSMSGPLHMLPRTRQERALWVLLSLTAGCCEELLYRGFIPAYLMYFVPGMPLLVALVISAIFFGIGHIYQKAAGVIGTTAMGLIFGFFYNFTGSLFLPMILHTLFDLRLILLDVKGLVDGPRPSPEEPLPQPS